MVKYDANLVPQLWFIFTEELPQPFGKAFQPTPPYGKIPVEHLKSLHGSSLSGQTIIIWNAPRTKRLTNGMPDKSHFFTRAHFEVWKFYTQKHLNHQPPQLSYYHHHLLQTLQFWPFSDNLLSGQPDNPDKEIPSSSLDNYQRIMTMIWKKNIG